MCVAYYQNVEQKCLVVERGVIRAWKGENLPRQGTSGWRTHSRGKSGELYNRKILSTTVVDKHHRMRYKNYQEGDAVRGDPPRQHPPCSAIPRMRCAMTRPIRPANGGATPGPSSTPNRAGDGYTIYDETLSHVRGPNDLLPMLSLCRASSRATKSTARRRLPADSRFHRQQRWPRVSRRD